MPNQEDLYLWQLYDSAKEAGTLRYLVNKYHSIESICKNCGNPHAFLNIASYNELLPDGRVWNYDVYEKEIGFFCPKCKSQWGTQQVLVKTDKYKISKVICEKCGNKRALSYFHILMKQFPDNTDSGEYWKPIGFNCSRCHDQWGSHWNNLTSFFVKWL
jgi:RNase P subunit RPR2